MGEFEEIVSGMVCLCGHPWSSHRRSLGSEYDEGVLRIYALVAPERYVRVHSEPCLECGCPTYREDGSDV